MSDQQQPGLRLTQIFLSKAHFEHGPDALSFPHNTKVTVHYGLSVEARGANDGKAGVVTVAIATVDQPDSLYRFHVEMTGIVEAEIETPNLSVEEYVTRMSVTMMYPFLREAVANLTGRGRFGAIYLKPFNVHSLELREKPEAATVEQ